MSKSIKVDVIFGFTTSAELYEEDFRAFESLGLVASPVCYSTDEEASEYIIGRQITRLSNAQQYKTINLSQEEQKQMQSQIFDALNAIAFDYEADKCELIVNTYYF